MSLIKFLVKVKRVELCQASSNRYKIGILAYGSLIKNPGEEIQPNIVKTKNAKTPFKVEFARSSSKRMGAPTLIPFREGANVRAKILVFRDDISEKEATDMLWRRETDQVFSDREYGPPSNPGINNVLVKKKENFQGVKIVLYTEIGRNINNLSPKTLAELAIKSVRSKAGKKGKDGISYLIDIKISGIKTPLMSEYEKEILRQTNTKSLHEAQRVLLGQHE